MEKSQKKFTAIPHAEPACVVVNGIPFHSAQALWDYFMEQAPEPKRPEFGLVAPDPLGNLEAAWAQKRHEEYVDLKTLKVKF